MSWNDSKSLGRVVKRACISRGECDSYTVLFWAAVMASVGWVPVEMTNVSAGGFPKIYCFSSLVMVFVPPVSLTENVTLSPACNVFNMPSCTLNCSVAPPVLAPTVPLCAC